MSFDVVALLFVWSMTLIAAAVSLARSVKNFPKAPAHVEARDSDEDDPGGNPDAYVVSEYTVSSAGRAAKAAAAVALVASSAVIAVGAMPSVFNAEPLVTWVFTVVGVSAIVGLGAWVLVERLAGD